MKIISSTYLPDTGFGTTIVRAGGKLYRRLEFGAHYYVWDHQETYAFVPCSSAPELERQYILLQRTQKLTRILHDVSLA